MTADDLEHELTTCRLLACSCPTCKTKPSIIYTPGCATMTCECVKLALPDWETRGVLRIWNRLCLGGAMQQRIADRMVQEHFEKVEK